MTGMPWGGSEVLWQRASRVLQQRGHQVTANYKWWPRKPAPLKMLEDYGGNLWLREQTPTKSEIRKAAIARWLGRKTMVANWLETERPDAVLFTVGFHPDPIEVADECLRLGIPYAINVQCASNTFFIHSSRVDDFRRWYGGAKRVYFVSPENEQKVVNNIGMPLSNSEIVANPFNVSHDANPAWPASNGKLRLAVVGRIHFQSKGQDIVIDVLRQDRWRQRQIEVRFYGHDQGHSRQLKELIRCYGLEERLMMGGFVENVEDIWKENHALLLPSRYEGAPLVVIEAMLCNRMAITTDIGRNRELIDDNESGFIAAAPTVEILDDALERAWRQRDRWQEIGQLAGQQIRQRYPLDPIAEFADRLISLAGNQ